MHKVRVADVQSRLLHNAPEEKHANSLLDSLLTKDLCLKAYLTEHCTFHPLVTVLGLSPVTLNPCVPMVSGSAPFCLL